jgi:DNA (cytosine-5)-methyltransferase 1
VTTLLEPAETLDWTHPQLVDDFDVIDLFAAAGGWDQGARALPDNLHERILGIEWEKWACRTAIAAGHRRLIADIAMLNPGDFTRTAVAGVVRVIRGIIASPPCQGFSMAGDGGGRRDTNLILEAVRVIGERPSDVDHIINDLADQAEDDKSALVLEPLRWVLDLNPEWTCWEQVPGVLPLWQACAKVLRKRGYKVWVGVLNAADYGVPQTRKRAILIASRVRYVSRPEPTHAKGGSDGDLFSDPLPPWISMAQALGWGMTGRPYVAVAAGTEAGGQDSLMAGGSGARDVVFGSRDRGEWVEQPEDHPLLRVQRSNYAHGDAPTAEKRGRSVRHLDQPSVALTGRPPQWLDIDEDTDLDDPTVQRALARDVELHAGTTGNHNGTVRPVDEPAPAVAFGHNAAKWQWKVREDGTQEPVDVDPADVEYVNGTHEHAARRPADEPAPTVMFGERLNTVEWQFRSAGLEGLGPELDPETQPAGTITTKGTAYWQPLPEGAAHTELRRSGDRIEEGFDPAAEPAATVTSRVDRWQTKATRPGDPDIDIVGLRREVGASRLDENGDKPVRPIDEPAFTITGGDPVAGGNIRYRWQPADPDPEGWAVRGMTEPAPTVVTTRRSGDGIIIGRQLPPGESRAVGGWGWDAGEAWCVVCRQPDTAHVATCPHRPRYTDDDEAGNALTRADGGIEGTLVRVNNQSGSDYDLDEQFAEPAATVAGRDLVPFRGANANRFNDSTKSRNDGVRVTVQEAAILQSFPPDYPWQGNKTTQYQQVGNAVPCLLASHILAETIGVPL